MYVLNNWSRLHAFLVPDEMGCEHSTQLCSIIPLFWVASTTLQLLVKGNLEYLNIPSKMVANSSSVGGTL